MSFSFRNLFSQDENGESPDERGGIQVQSPPAKSNMTSYEVRELLPFIPPAIVAQGEIPMTQEVKITLPADGSNDVRLSTIYQSCPALFAAEITPLNDSVVTLPQKKPVAAAAAQEEAFQNAASENPFQDGALSSGSPENAFGFPQSFGSNSANNPFSGDAPDDDIPKGFTAPETSPIGSPAHSSSGANPFADASSSFEEIVKKEEKTEVPQAPDMPTDSHPEGGKKPEAVAGQFENPFDSAASEGFSQLFSGSGPEEKTRKPEAPEHAHGGNNGGDGGLSFSSIAKGETPAAAKNEDPPEGLGRVFKEATGEYVGVPTMDETDSPFSSMNSDEKGAFEAFIPPSLTDDDEDDSPANEDEKDEPETFIPPLIFSGEEEVSEKEEPPAVTPHDFQPKGNQPPAESAASFFDMQPKGSPSPLDEAPGFQAVPPGSDKPEPTPEAAAPAAKVEKEAPAQPPELPKEALFPSQPPRAAEEPKPEPRQENAFSQPQAQPPMDAFAALPDQTPREPKPEPTPEKAAEPPVQQQQPFPTPAQPKEPEPVKEEPVVAQPKPEPEPTPAPAPVAEKAPQPQPQPVREEPATLETPISRPKPSAPAAFGFPSVPMKQIELRAIFQTDEEFTLRKVSQKVAAMESVLACAVVTRDRVIEAFADQKYAIGDRIQTMSEHVRGLAAMSGSSDASYFTIQMDSGVMSFFFGGDNLLAVKHLPELFRPGVRETLILIARSLDSLES